VLGRGSFDEVSAKFAAGVAMAKHSSSKSSSEASKVKAVNLAYYKALSARDLRAMEAVWTCGADNILIAPPANPHSNVGWAAIKRNWEAYWPTFDQFSVSMRVTKVNISGPVAWVHGVETSHRRETRGNVSSSRNYGTNIFVNRHGRWRMTFHQSAMISKDSKA
jgi:ketosteroid isomerase-like protein